MIFGEDESSQPMQPQQPQQQIQLDASGMESVYANFFALSGSADEIQFYLGSNVQLPGMKAPAVKLSHRLVLIPSNAKRLMLALQQTIQAHEDRFGPIEVAPPNKPPGQQR